MAAILNPFVPLYAACDLGPENGVHDGPLMLDVELTNSCNMRCRMCPTGRMELKRPTEMMPRETLVALLDQADRYRCALRFIGWGEPTQHPDLVWAISYASEAGLLTHINTNGILMTEKLAGELVAAGLSSIKFSFQGVDRESYADMRMQDFFEELLGRIKRVKDARNDRELPFIAASTTITTESPAQVREFRERIKPLVDHLSIGKTIMDFLNIPGDDKVDEGLGHPDPCPEVWAKLSIASNGQIKVCCNDYSNITDCGNVKTTSLLDAWKHPTMVKYRTALAAGNYDQPLCKDCYVYLDEK